MTPHAVYATKTRATTCTASHVGFGGRCFNCGFDPNPKPEHKPTRAERVERLRSLGFFIPMEGDK